MHSNNIYFYSSITADVFKNLMKELQNERIALNKLSVSTCLTEALLKPNGFNAYFDYISSISDDESECANVFCKIVLTRPSKFSADIVHKCC